jgi:hypothetical protein
MALEQPLNIIKRRSEFQCAQSAGHERPAEDYAAMTSWFVILTNKLGQTDRK